MKNQSKEIDNLKKEIQDLQSKYDALKMQTEGKVDKNKRLDQEQRYRTVFENSPVSIWEEDLSSIKIYFEELKEQGVNDINSYFNEHPEVVKKCSEMVKIIDVNHSTLVLHDAETKDELFANLTNTFIPKSYVIFRKALISIWNGCTEMTYDTVVKTLKGKHRNVTMFLSVCYGSEKTLSKVIVSLVDITERVKAEFDLKKSEKRNHMMFSVMDEGVAINEIIRDKKGDVVDYMILDVNPAFTKQTGFKKNQVLGRLATELYGMTSVYITEWWKKHAEENCAVHTEFYHPVFKKWFHVVTAPPVGKRFATFTQDITERKRLTDNLAMREREFRSLAENLPDNISRYDKEGRMIYVNQMLQKTLGLSASEMIGTIPGEAKRIYESQSFQHNINEVLKNGEETEMDIVLPDLGEGARYHNVRFVPEQDDDDSVAGVLVIGRDMTQRKQAEEFIKASEERYRLIAENTADTISIRDFELNTIYVSPSVEKLRGYTVEETMSQAIGEVLTPASIHKVKNGLAEQLKLEETKTADPSRSVLMELEQIHKNGSIILVEVSVSFIRNDKLEPINLLIITRDITQRKQAEERIKVLSHAVEQNPIVIVITNTDGDIEYANPRFEDVTGYPVSEAIGKNPRILKSDKMPEQVYKDMWDTLLKGNVWRGEVINKNSAGGYYWANLTISPIIDSAGKITHYVGIQEEISERKKIEEELILAKEKAEESDRLKSAFLANMSHEIRTPMNGILGFAKLLNEAELSGDEQKRYIEIIEKSGVRMLNIINDIVDISKIESGLMNIDINVSNINDQVEYIYTFFKPEVEAKGLTLLYEVGLISAEAIVETDREKVFAILINLVKNAIKYTQKGAIEFGYKRKRNYLEFYVKDSGVGIPKDRQEAIFERFIQAEVQDKMARQGAGLGLAISKAYVEMLGGKIWVESDGENGSIFYFTIPYNETINNEIKTKMADETVKLSLKVLIVEDDEISSQLLAIIADKFAKEIVFARDGMEAIDACRSNSDFDLILMDIQMPGLDGYEASRQIRQFNKEVVIIAQTAFALSGDREKTLAVGCNDYLSKPINAEEFDAVIRKHFKE